MTDAMVEAVVQAVRRYTRGTLFIDEHRELVRDALKAAMEADDEPRAYIVHAPEDDYYGTGPDRLQFHPLAQHDMDNGYRQTPLYERPAEQAVTDATAPTGRVSIAHDGFSGDIIGHYTTREGKRGVVVQQDGTRVVHVYGEKWLTPPLNQSEKEISHD